MKVLWLGQAGLLFVSGKRKVMVDPYLTNSLSFIDYTLDRQIPVNKKVFSVSPDVMVLTNCHPDHADIDTISKFAKKQKNKLTILSCESVFLEIADCGYCAIANNIMLEPGSEWTIDGFNILAVTAKTDDRSAIGVIITDTQDGKKYYVTGDTLYSNQVLKDLPSDIYAVFLPINGEYGSMNMLDAKRFTLQIGARHVVPLHFGMFDQIDPNAFDIENKVIPQPYKIIDFEDEEILADNKLLDKKFNERPATYEKIAKAEEADKDLTYDEADVAPVIDSEAEATELDKEAEVNAEATIKELDMVVYEPVEEADEIECEADETEGEANEAVTEDAEGITEEDAVEVEIYEGLEEQDSAPLEDTEASNEEASEKNCFNDFENEPETDYDEVTIEAENILEAEDITSDDYENEEITDTTEDDADIEGDEVVDDEYDEPLYDDFDDFDESDEDYEERKSQVFEPFTPEELMSYASDSSDAEATDTDDTNEDFGQDVDENGLDTTKNGNTSEDIEPSEEDDSTKEETIDYSFSDFDDEPVVSEDEPIEEADEDENEAVEEAVEEADEGENEAVEEASEEAVDEVEGEADPSTSTYVSKPTNDDTDDADKIDAYVKELEKLDRGETPKF